MKKLLFIPVPKDAVFNVLLESNKTETNILYFAEKTERTKDIVYKPVSYVSRSNQTIDFVAKHEFFFLTKETKQGDFI